MIDWIQGKAVSLLLIALLLVAGFAAFYYVDAKFTSAKLATNELQLAKATTSLATITQVFSNYQAAVAKDQESYQALQDSIKAIGQGVSNVNQRVKAYAPTAILDDPWPSDFIRLRGQTPGIVPSTGSSTKDSTTVRSP